jgi:hypothetical protein
MKSSKVAAFCLAVVVSSHQVALGQSPIPATDSVVQEGISDARTIVANITVAPGSPGWLGRLARKVQLGMCLKNFEKMLKKGKVIGGDPRVRGTQAATTPESQRNGQSVSTTGVGVGDEKILLGPNTPAMHPTERGQKFIHEGARVKQRYEITNATLLPGNGGPGPAAPAGERCRWLQNEREVYEADAEYYEEAAAQAQAAGAAANVVNALQKTAQQKRDKADSIKKELERDC